MTKRTKQLLIRFLVTASIPAAGLAFVLAFPGVTTPKKLTDAEVYDAHCGNCHGKQGEGLRNLYPPLANSDYLREHRAQLPCIIRYGLEGEIQVNGKSYNQAMAGLELSPGEIARIINYVNTSWGNELPETTTRDVKETLSRCAVPVGTEGK